MSTEPDTSAQIAEQLALYSAMYRVISAGEVAMEIVLKSSSRATAQRLVEDRLGITGGHAQSVLDLQLFHFTEEYRTRLAAQIEDLKARL